MFDPDDPEYQLRWPRDLFTGELRQILGGQGFSLTDAIDLLFEEALAGRQPRDDLADALESDQAAAFYNGDSLDEYAITRTVAFAKEVLAAADQLPAFQPRRYWTARLRPEPPPRAGDRHGLQLDWQGRVSGLVETGYLDRMAGDNCPDTFGPGRNSRIRELLGGRAGIDEDLWVGTDDPWGHPIDDDEFYTLVEVMHDLVARPRTFSRHPHCGQRHYGNYSRTTGQALYRWQVNDLFNRHQTGLRLAAEGEDTGLLVQAVDDPRQELLEQVAQDVPDGNENRVGHAVAVYRNRHATSDDKRRACRELADVFEDRKTTVLKRHLVKDDEGPLFDIANRFAIRHHNNDQMYDYDEAFLDWIFWWYLATVELTNRLIARGEAVGD